MKEVVETRQLTRRFGDFVAVDAVSLSIAAGQIYGFLGPNGSGKSTTIRMLCGLLQPSSGAGSILGLDIQRQAEAVKEHIGYMSQRFSLYEDLTVRENLSFYAGMYGLGGSCRRQRIEEMMHMAGLEGRQRELAANLAGGWRQRLALGCAILHRPPVLFLDEPTGGVDPLSRRLFWDLIYGLAAQGTTVMVTTHFMDEAEHCERIGFLYEGRLLADDAPECLKDKLPGVLMALDSEDPLALLPAVERQVRPLDAYPFGAALHVRVAPEQEEALVPWHARRVAPTLEDVFVYYVRQGRAAGEVV